MSYVVPTANPEVLQVIAGANVTITGTKQYPIINSSGGGGGGAVNSIIAGIGIRVDGATGDVTITNHGIVNLNSADEYTTVSIDSIGNATIGNQTNYVAGTGIAVTLGGDEAFDVQIDNTGVVSVINNSTSLYTGLNFLTFDGNSHAIILSSFIDWVSGDFSLLNAGGGELNISPQTSDQNHYSDNGSYTYDDGYLLMTTITLNADLANQGLVTYTFTIDIDESTMSFTNKSAPACIIYTYSDPLGANILKWTRDITSLKDGSDYLGQTTRYDTFSFQKTNWPSNFTWTVEYINVQSDDVPSFTIAWTTTLAGTGY